MKQKDLDSFTKEELFEQVKSCNINGHAFASLILIIWILAKSFRLLYFPDQDFFYWLVLDCFPWVIISKLWMDDALERLQDIKEYLRFYDAYSKFCKIVEIISLIIAICNIIYIFYLMIINTKSGVDLTYHTGLLAIWFAVFAYLLYVILKRGKFKYDKLIARLKELVEQEKSLS